MKGTGLRRSLQKHNAERMEEKGKEVAYLVYTIGIRL